MSNLIPEHELFTLGDEKRSFAQITVCRDCADKKANGMAHVYVRRGLYRCVECEGEFCREHAIGHFTGHKMERPLHCQTLEIANEAITLLTTERDQLRADLAVSQARERAAVAEVERLKTELLRRKD